MDKTAPAANQKDLDNQDSTILRPATLSLQTCQDTQAGTDWLEWASLFG